MPTGPTRLLTLDEAAQALNQSPATLRYWRARNEGPRAAKIGRRVMYREVDIEEWIADQFEAGE